MSYRLAFIFLFFSLAVSAQNKFASQFIETIWSKLPMDCQKTLNAQKECDCIIRGSVYHLKSEFDGYKIVHLGIKIFNDSITRADNPFVYQFIERELLLFILNDEQLRNARQQEDKIYLYYTSTFKKRSLLRDPGLISNVVSGLSGVSVKQDSLTCKVLLYNTDSERLEIEFPKINTLIRSMDKKELDDYIFSELLKDIHDWQQQGNNLAPGPLHREKNLFVSEGEQYMIKGLSSNKYYKRMNDNIVVLFQPDFISESFSNLFLTDLPLRNQTQLDLKVKIYGGKDQLISTTVGQFLDHFDSHYKLYFGVESAEPDGIRGSLIIYCPELNYIHLLDVKTTANSLFEHHAKVSGIMYPYIPSHNIKELFGKNDGNEPVLDNLIKWE